VHLGFPPKIVWLRLGNCTTRDVEAALRLNHSSLEAFDQDAAVGVFSTLP
jgi:predicted nuclease of predicted toxin-antitoxin system